MRGYIKQKTNSAGVKRTFFVSCAGMCFVWYHGAWRLFRELGTDKYLVFEAVAISKGWFFVTDIKWTHKKFMSVRVALDPIDYEYHKFSCRRMMYSNAMRKRDEILGK